MRKLAAAGVALGLGGLAASFAIGGATAATIDARLQGTFVMEGKITAAQHVLGEHAGQKVSRSWSFYPTCASGPCAKVVLKRWRSSRHVLDTIALARRSPGVYVGKHRFWLTLNCNGSSVKHGGYANETITVRITRAVTNGGSRVATGIQASYVNPSRYNLTRCPGGIGHDAAGYHGHLSATALAASASGGYLIMTADGDVFKFGKATLHGSDAGKLPVQVRAVRLAAEPKGSGYWILRSDGGVDAFGAPGSGSLKGKLHGTRPVAIAAPPGGGYLILTSDGGVHPFGGASWHGSDKGKVGHGVGAVSLAVDSSGGYWVLLSNGAVDAFSAPKSGSLQGKLHGTRPVAIAAGATKGYWILISNGGVHPFGGAAKHGSDAGKLPSGVSALALAGDPATSGYWLLKSNGGLDGFGAPKLGSLGG